MKSPITAHFANSCERPPEAVALRFKRHKSWIALNWQDYFRQVEAVAHGLDHLGLMRGDRVAILANTRWEWAALDFAIMGLGAATVPIYHSSRPEEIEFIITNSQAKILVVEDVAQLRKWESLTRRSRATDSSIHHVVVLTPPEDLPKGTLAWDDLCDLGARLASAKPKWFTQSCRSVQLSDLASIVYTSGTTGEPKGVVILHEQIVSEVEALIVAYPISAQDSTLCFLPFAHVLGRVELWLHAYLGFTLNFAESLDRLRKNLQEVQPTVMIGVPRIFEKIYAGVVTEIQGHHWRQRVFKILEQDAKKTLATWTPAAGLVGWLLNIPRRYALDQLLYSRVRQGLGGQLRFAVSGGAPLEPRIAEFFRSAGLLILEGYGLTETTAAICVNTPSQYRFGTVGKPLQGVDIELAEDGEILVRGGMVMTGYFADQDSTKNAIHDDFFSTGDIGEWTEDGFLRITERKKDLIKTAGGKYVAPQKLEGLLKLDPLISHALIHGDRKKYVVALITMDEARLKSLAREKGWRFRDYRSLTQSPEVRETVRKIVAQANAQLASHETIKSFAILPQDFSIETGELTPSLKIKRRICDERYQSQIEALY